MPSLLWILACAGTDGSETGPGSLLTQTDADLVFLPPVVDLGRLEVPCGERAVVQITNHGHRDRRLDQLALETGADLTLETLLELPRVVHPGEVLELVLRVDAQQPEPLSGQIRMVGDEGVRTAPLAGEVRYRARTSESFLTPLPAADVLWVVDHTGQMETRYSDELARGADDYLDALSAVADWRLLLVTDDSGCGNGPVLTASSPDPAGALAAHAFDPGGSAYGHALLELASHALAEDNPQECNHAFRRAEAQLVVVAVTDAPDQSGEDWSWWVTDYYRYADVVGVAGVLDAGDTCGTGPDGYLDAVQSTGGVAVDLCDDEFGKDLDRLADAVTDMAPTFVLADPAVPDTVEVTVDGSAVSASVDPTGFLLTLDTPATAGSVVAVDYAIAGICPGG